MRGLGWFFIGAVSVLVILAGGALIWISQARGFSARERPTALEAWIAGWLRAAAMPRQAAVLKNPVANTPETLSQARAHWADHCAGCHSNNGSGDTQLGRHSYPPAPDMRLPATQQLTDGELFYVIQNGIRLSAMPAWGGSAADEADSWKLVHFIRHLPQMTFEETKAMEKLNPKSPQDLQEEQEEEKFLNGEDTREPTEHHHH